MMCEAHACLCCWRAYTDRHRRRADVDACARATDDRQGDLSSYMNRSIIRAFCNAPPAPHRKSPCCRWIFINNFTYTRTHERSARGKTLFAPVRAQQNGATEKTARQPPAVDSSTLRRRNFQFLVTLGRILDSTRWQM